MLSKLRCRAEGGRIQNGRYFPGTHKAEKRLAALWKSGPLPFVKGAQGVAPPNGSPIAQALLFAIEPQ
jgi:hypothetical protein